MFVILEGEIQVKTTSVDGLDIWFAGLGAGAVVGEMAVIDGGLRSADLAAVGAVRLWRIPRGALLDALTSEPSAAKALMVELARRLRVANDALEALRTLDLGGRLARLLLDTMNETGLVRLTQKEAALRLGVSREAVNRKLNRWAGLGWVCLSRAGVSVLDEARLASVGREARP